MASSMKEDFSWLPATKTYKGTEQTTIVFFIVDVMELFNVDLKHPGITNALNKAMKECLNYCPRQTGLMASSFTAKQLDSNRVEYYFDPKKIIGKMRLGVKVESYYPAYVAETAKHFNFLSIMMHVFYTTLFKEVKQLYKQQEQLKKQFVKQNKDTSKLSMNLAYATLFMTVMDDEYKRMKEEKKKQIEIQKQKQKLKQIAIEQKKKELLLKKKAREQKDLEVE